MDNTTPIGLRGFLIDTPARGTVRGLRDGALILDGGLIAERGDYDALRAKYPPGTVKWMHSPDSLLLPGFVDSHAHLPQYPAVGHAESSYSIWLERQISPLERGFNGVTSKTQAPAFYEALARHGTTCAVLYAGRSAESCEAAFSAAENHGLRIILGKMMLDIGSPGSLLPEKNLEKSCSDSESLCRKWHGRAGGRLEYAFSPLSPLTSSETLMRRVAELANLHGTYIQANLSAKASDADAVKQLFPQFANFTDVYAQLGMLGTRTVLGHCVHVQAEEIAKLAEFGAAVAFCPTADFFHNHGTMRLDDLENAGLRTALASGVGAGPELNMWQVMRSAIETQKARSYHDPRVFIPDVADVFFLATRGGAGALGKQATIGTLEVGLEADVVVWDVAHALPYGRKSNPHANLSPEEVLSLLVYRGNSSCVVETFVRGRSVYKAPAPLLL